MQQELAHLSHLFTLATDRAIASPVTFMRSPSDRIEIQYGYLS
ncbi:hypothetical protein [Thermocoleostomius sinensis]|uniref:Uncharacterized protein n=1 Tax=Thermocoleostomius sinensis A174 TaxID=2016057 RepID=A0A9E9C494_9CYAN|nr:hypothetical protein [Thermocoleostomius sinensis]WAL59791.1 hypothetical protein OXH18_21865 [Thermocoleostomius sinensis A174]